MWTVEIQPTVMVIVSIKYYLCAMYHLSGCSTTNIFFDIKYCACSWRAQMILILCHLTNLVCALSVQLPRSDIWWKIICSHWLSFHTIALVANEGYERKLPESLHCGWYGSSRLDYDTTKNSMHLNELENTMQGQNPADGSSELIISNVIGSRFLFLVRLCCLSEATYFLHGI